MRFNQIVWDALCYAASKPGTHRGYEALQAYAADCDGKIKINPYMEKVTDKDGLRDAPIYKFVPNPDSQY